MNVLWLMKVMMNDGYDEEDEGDLALAENDNII